MAIFEKNRKIRPSTHQSSSPYRVHCNEVSIGDTLRININHESDLSVNFFYEVVGQEIDSFNSIHFNAIQIGGIWQITWIQNINMRQIQ